MKNIMTLFFITLAVSSAWAIPVVNENVANSGVMTIYPDHQDPHRYYVAPNVVMIATNSEGVPYFSYGEFRKNLINKIGVISMTLVPAYTREELELAKAEILKKDPKAEFSGVPFIESKLSLTGVLAELIGENECNHRGGLIGQEQSCAIVLTSKGRTFFLKSIQKRTLFTTLQFEYALQAVVRKADGSFVDQEINHGVAVRIDGDQLSKYPQLINPL
ncbi:hypothetical protein [Bdellovibrio sp. BCCA]|uniref:hypothetical protein n=1 Tax=Bdellovibrio sp. BCCA TaxID=3136281 RepID=UPI0030F31A7F